MADVVIKFNSETDTVSICSMGTPTAENFEIKLGCPNGTCIRWAVINIQLKKQLLKLLVANL